MVMTDPIADLLTRIRNANIAYHETLDVPASKMKQSVLQVLKDEGFIRDFEYIEDGASSLDSSASAVPVFGFMLAVTRFRGFWAVSVSLSFPHRVD